ncbi:MAG: helix-turn-helix domain-containing protein [Acidimicrobiales bacterium]
MSELKFRNVDANPENPVEDWPFEATLAAVERGTLPDWRRLAATIKRDPWGPVAQAVTQAVAISRPYGTTELLLGVVAAARESSIAAERAEVASEVEALLSRSGLTRVEFARRIGTSPSRLSTYLSAKVVPSAALMVRMRRCAHFVAVTLSDLSQQTGGA